MKQAILIVLSFLSVVVTAGPADDLYTRLKTIDTLKGTFEQVIVDVDGETLQETAGEFALKRPGLFRWETTEPYPQLIVANVDRVWLYDPDLEQVTEKRYKKGNNDAPIWLLTAKLDTLKNDYQVTPLNDEVDTFLLLPKGDSAYLKKVTLKFIDGQIARMNITDNIDQVTQLTLSVKEAHGELNDSLFNFVPPEGVDIIYDEQ